MPTLQGQFVNATFTRLLQLYSGTVQTGDGTSTPLGLTESAVTIGGATFTTTSGRTYTFPSVTSTISSLAGTETLTNKTITAAVLSGSFTGTYTLAGTPTINSATLTSPVLGTPSSGTLTNCTGLPISTGVSGLGTGVATVLATPSSANLASAITDETGSGALVFADTPTLVTPILGTPTSGTLTNCTIPESGITGSAWTADSATVTGFSSTSAIAMVSKKIGKTQYVRLTIVGTSNATTFTVTNLPSTANTSANQVFTGVATDNGTNAIGYARVDANTTTVTFFKSGSAASSDWTNSGTKGFLVTLIYETT